MIISRLIPLCLALSFSSAACATRGHRVTDEIEALMRAYEGAVPGASLLVVRDGVPVIRRAWGLSNLEDGIAATPETNYRLASVTKQFTAAAILLLTEDRKVSLGDHVGKWLPTLPATTGAITIRHLLTHTSGIIDYEDLIPAGATAQLRDAGVLHLLESQDSLYFTPGTAYRYSNSGYALLALIVERASAQSFGSFLKNRIFLPLGMQATVAHEEGTSTVSMRAFGYTRKDGDWARRDQSITSAVLGDGGIYSSIDDLAKWDAALYDSRLLSDESRRLVFTPHTGTADANTRYGFGWRITGEMVWHSGETSGFRNVILRFPAKLLSVVILTNRDDPPPYATALAIAKIVLDEGQRGR